MEALFYFNYPAKYRTDIYKSVSLKYTHAQFLFGLYESDIPKIEDDYLLSKSTWIEFYRLFGVLKISINIRQTVKCIKATNLIMTGEYFNVNDWVILVIRKIANKRTILWNHGILSAERSFKTIVKVLFYSLSSEFWLYNNRAKSMMMRYSLLRNSRFTIIYNSLPDGFTPRKKIHLSLNKRPYTLIFIGRLTPRKRLDLLIDALAELNTSATWNLNIVGDGECKASLKELVNRYGLVKQVVFHGSVDKSEDLAPIFRDSRICVSPGNVGLTAIHSLYFGVPVVTHNNLNDQMPEAESINSNNGRLFDHGNLNSLVNSLVSCNNYIEEGRITTESCVNSVSNEYSINYQLKTIGECLDSE